MRPPSSSSSSAAALERSSPFYHQIPQTEFRIIELNKRLQNRPRLLGPPRTLPFDELDDSRWWKQFACDFFDDDATLSVQIPGEDKPIEYKIGRTMIPRFFKSYFEGGVMDFCIKLRNIMETTQRSSSITLDCDQTDLTTKNFFRHQGSSGQALSVIVHTEGHLSVDFVVGANSLDELLIKSWRFYANQCHEYVDRSMTAVGMGNLTEPVTRFGLPKSTVSFLRTCMIMEPMQELMFHHRSTNMKPRACLKHLLYDRFKFKSVDETPAPPAKRRRRKAAANTGGAGGSAAGGAAKRTKVNNTNSNTMVGGPAANCPSTNAPVSNLGNNLLQSGLVSPVGQASDLVPNSLPTSQDALIVGEPSMLGAEFGDENERRLESKKFEPSTSPPMSLALEGSNNQTIPQLITAETSGAALTSQQSCSNHSSQNSIISQQQPQQIPQHQQAQSQPKTHQQTQSSENQIDSIASSLPDHQHHQQQKQQQPQQQQQQQQQQHQDLQQQSQTQPQKQQSMSSDNDTLLPSPPDQLKQQPSKVCFEENSNQMSSSMANGDDVLLIKTESCDLKPQQSQEIASPVSNSSASIKSDQTNRTDSYQPGKENNNEESSLKSTSSMVVGGSVKAAGIVPSNKQNRRRSSERKETLREGLMRTSDFVVAMKDLKLEHPSLWRITTGNNLLQQFEPKIQNGVILFENTNQYAGWNPEIRKDYVGVDVRLTQHTRNQITVERLLLNFQKIEDAEAFHDRHFMIYLQILISTALDPKFWDGIESELKHQDYFITSRKIVEDIIKRYKLKLASRLKLGEYPLKDFEKYPNLIIKPIEGVQEKATSASSTTSSSSSSSSSASLPSSCRACNSNPITQQVTFENRSYDLHTFKPVKVTSETKSKDQYQLCDACIEIVKLFSSIHHMGWKFFNFAREKTNQLRAKGKPINVVLDECLKDEDWMNKVFAERDTIWSKIDQLQ